MLTPIQNRNGIWYKREDLYRSDKTGVNGAKYRACQHLVGKARAAGATRVVSAASVLSPQSAIAATVASEQGMSSTVIVGGTTPEKAIRHPSIRIAASVGAELESINIGYNHQLQLAGARRAGEEAGAWQLPYGITTPPDASEEELDAFFAVGGNQVAELPAEVKTVVLPFGSGNTACGVLYGLYNDRENMVEDVVLVGIGPDRLAWSLERLRRVGVTQADLPRLHHFPLHPWFATYGDRMPETMDGITLHPTYEGKVARYLRQVQPDYWRRDGSTMFWIVGGPVD